MKHTWLLILALLVLAACGAAPSTSTGATTELTPASESNAAAASMSVAAVDPSPSAPPTPAAGETNVPAPTATDVPLLPSATGEASAVDEDAVLCTLTQSGGFAGVTETVTVLANGKVTAARDRPQARSGTTQATPEQLAALRDAIESEEWQQLQGRYGRTIPDGFTYEVQCGGATIVTYDAAERPAVLNQVIQQLSALRGQALQQ